MSRRLATSANALTLPSTPSAKLEIVGGRQRVARFGIFFTIVGKHLRSVYEQLDGKIILADECECRMDFPEKFFPDDCARGVSFVVTPSLECPIDHHKAFALQNAEAS